jgi:xylulokinase
MAERSWRLGIDLGTSSIKLAVLSESGQLRAHSAAEFPTISDAVGQAEQEPQAWLAALCRACAKLRQELGAEWGKVGGIGLAGQLPTLVCLGQQESWPRAITWLDARADTWATSQIDLATRDAMYRRTGMPIDGRYLVPMLCFHHGREPAGLTSILSAKDWLCWVLTGNRVTDPSTAAGYGVFDIVSGGWALDLCEFWGIQPAYLPVVSAAGAVAGALCSNAAALLGLPADTPVHVGAADSVAGAFALGGSDPSTVCVMMGSSTVLMGYATSPTADAEARFLLTPLIRPGEWGREMDLLTTGSGHRWLGDLLRLAPSELESLAVSSEAGARGLLFAPYLAGGEQGALWDTTLSGVLHGLTLAHNAADVVRAYLEGVQFEIRRCLDAFAEMAAVTRIILSGGMVESADTIKMLADITGRSVIPYLGISPAARGAALLAMPISPEMATSSAGFAPAVEPGSRQSLYDALYRRYQTLFPRIARSARSSTD